MVLSHPYLWEEVRANSAQAAEIEVWEQRSITWLRAKYGDQLLSVVRHTDEAHPHLHAFLLPDDPEMRAKSLHPGHTAKAEARAKAEAEGLDAKASNKLGDRAYCEALRAWQDDYFEAVGAPCGLTRLGPGRRRLTRGQWQAEKAASRAALVVESAAERARRDLAALEAQAASVRQQARQYVQDARQRIEAATTVETRAKGLADHAAAVRRQAEQAKREAAAIEVRHSPWLASLAGARR